MGNASTVAIVPAESPRKIGTTPRSPRSFNATASTKEDALKILAAQVEVVTGSHEITTSEGQWIQVCYFVRFQQDISNPSQWHASVTI